MEERDRALGTRGKNKGGNAGKQFRFHTRELGVVMVTFAGGQELCAWLMAHSDGL